MKLTDLSVTKREGVYAHLEAINLLAGVTTVAIVLSSGADEERNEIRDMLRDRHGEDVYDPRTHRLVAIMAADREPGDAAQAVEDVMIGNADAARVFDAIGEAFGVRSDGGHVNLDIHIDNDRVSIESWAPPRRAEVPLDALRGLTDATREMMECTQPGEKITPTTATDIPARQALQFAIGQKVFVVYGDQQAGPARITAYSVYEKTGTQYLAEWITPEGTPKSVWSTADAFRPAQVEHSSIAPDYFPE